MPSNPMETTIPAANDEYSSRIHVRHHSSQPTIHVATPMRSRATSIEHFNVVPPISPKPKFHQASPIASKPIPSKLRRRKLLIYVYNQCRHLQNTPRRKLYVLVALVSTLLLPIICYVCFWIFHHMQCYRRELGVVWKEAPIHSLSRTCPAPGYDVIAQDSFGTAPSICMTTLTDRRSPSWYQRLVRCRDFDALEQISFPNHQRYALKHNYLWKDASDLVDPARPPAWSKIRAVQSLLTESIHPAAVTSTKTTRRCDWVLWLDADVLIMNSSIRLHDLLPSNPETMLIATHDRKYTVNSGVWLLRNSEWSRKFLSDWWNLKSWVRRPGMSLSGDNAAFGHLVDQVLRSEPWRVEVPPRCNLNSFGVFLTDQQEKELEQGGAELLQQQEWYMSDKFYHKGDFINHASGIDKKKEVLEILVKRAL